MLDKTLEHFRNLVSLAAADGTIDKVERETLHKIASQHDISLERVEFMLSKAPEYVYIIPQNQEDREKQLEDMLNFAMLDGHYATGEHELILMVGKKLGFTGDQLNEIINHHLKGRKI